MSLPPLAVPAPATPPACCPAVPPDARPWPPRRAAPQDPSIGLEPFAPIGPPPLRTPPPPCCRPCAPLPPAPPPPPCLAGAAPPRARPHAKHAARYERFVAKPQGQDHSPARGCAPGRGWRWSARPRCCPPIAPENSDRRNCWAASALAPPQAPLAAAKPPRWPLPPRPFRPRCMPANGAEWCAANFALAASSRTRTRASARDLLARLCQAGSPNCLVAAPGSGARGNERTTKRLPGAAGAPTTDEAAAAPRAVTATRERNRRSALGCRAARRQTESASEKWRERRSPARTRTPRIPPRRDLCPQASSTL
jgi:hypothetical protein